MSAIWEQMIRARWRRSCARSCRPPNRYAIRSREIIARVRADGDAAVSEYTQLFDTAGSPPPPLVVGQAQLDSAEQALDPAVRFGLEQAVENVRRVAREALHADRSVELGGYRVLLREAPVARAAIYVPGGRAPYPSTVVMGVVPAQVAGVEQIAVCAPPARDGRLDAVVLGACRLAGASIVYAMGGAQAIAALAYGTESVDPVDVIVGPGNLYVQEAKRQVFGQVGIDGFAGPSDLVVIADGDADPAPLALDLLAQAEHGPGTLVVGISPSAGMLDAWQASLGKAPETGAVACLVHAADTAQAGALAARARTRASAARRSRRRAARARDHARRLRVRRPGGRAPHSATTSPARTTSCRQPARRGSRRR